MTQRVYGPENLATHRRRPPWRSWMACQPNASDKGPPTRHFDDAHDGHAVADCPAGPSPPTGAVSFRVRINRHTALASRRTWRALRGNRGATTSALKRITIARAGKPVAQLGPAPRAKRAAVLLNLDEFAVDGRGGRMTNEDIDRILYGGP